ncbi:LysR family transcriptional regulator [Youngiibacter multivorans]|uniref:DNA-binding transcriptional LysR family regulator n=1 Tax=Youngiibacter multivorans TaxID=937251 RepID=A0ABS4G6S3_9CLOT|nr:LysR family transcriptional regulator [Youngiibacter multivorans]MBP1920278.1 DNA-binding transcriptional LysR family regulator [Youngiibacter multivorans]
MDNIDVESVLNVARYLNFAFAAEDMSFSASAISKRIMSVEKELGVMLFERNGRQKVALTQVGEEILPFFKRIKLEHDHIINYISSDKKRLTLNTACSYFIGAVGVEKAFMNYILDHPNIEAKIGIVDDAEIIRRMISGNIDLGITLVMGNIDKKKIFIDYPNDNFEVIEIQKKIPLIALSTKDSLAYAKEITYESLNDRKFVFMKHEYCGIDTERRIAVENACLKSGFKCNAIYVEDPTGKLALDMVENNKAVALLVAHPDYQSTKIKIRKISNCPYEITLVAYYLKERVSSELAEFIKYLCSVFRDNN